MNIFLTGGSSGIGRCLKEHLILSHAVTAPDRTAVDLSRYPQVQLDLYDAIVLCAGSDLGGKKSFITMQDQHWQNTLQVNLLSNMKLIKDYVSCRGSKWSKIVVLGSTATDHIWPNMLPYTVSKIGLEQFCRGLRQEIGRNVGISIVRPGLTKTNFNLARHMGSIDQQESDQWYDSQPCLKPEHFVPVIDSILDDRDHRLQEFTVSL